MGVNKINLKEGDKICYLFRSWIIIEIIDRKNFYIKDSENFGMLVSQAELEKDNNFKIIEREEKKSFQFLITSDFFKIVISSFFLRLTRLR